MHPQVCCNIRSSIMEMHMSSESPRRVDVFFYGLFMDKELLMAKGCSPANERIAAMHGFTLRIGERATLVPNLGTTVYGVIMSLPQEEVHALYSDASVSMYRPEALLAELADGMLIPVLCFNLPTPPSPEKHNPEYAAKLRDLAHRLGLPEAYVESIR